MSKLWFGYNQGGSKVSLSEFQVFFATFQIVEMQDVNFVSSYQNTNSASVTPKMCFLLFIIHKHQVYSREFSVSQQVNDPIELIQAHYVWAGCWPLEDNPVMKCYNNMLYFSKSSIKTLGWGKNKENRWNGLLPAHSMNLTLLWKHFDSTLNILYNNILIEFCFEFYFKDLQYN